MKKTIKVYDIQITAGPDAGCYRMFGVWDKARAEELAADFANQCGTADIVIERDEEITEFADQDDMMSWLMGEEPNAYGQKG